MDNSLYLFRPLSNKTTVLHPILNGKNSIKTISAKTRDNKYNYLNNNRNWDFNFNNFNNKNNLFFGLSNKKIENKKKEEMFSINNNDNNINDLTI